MSILTLAIAAVGFLTAALSGVAGLGGGTILIGVLYALGLTPTVAVPLFAAVQFVSNLSRTAAYFKHVEWRAAGWFALTGVPTPFLIAPFVAAANVHVILVLLAGLILVSLIPLPAGRGRPAPSPGPAGHPLPLAGEGKSPRPLAAPNSGGEPIPATPAFMLAGFLNGSIGMFVGATGLFVGRLFLRPEWSKEKVIGTLALCQTLGHLLKVLGYASVGFLISERSDLLWPLVLAVIAGTVAGRRLNRYLDETSFRRLFNALLIVLSLKLIWDGVIGLLA